MTPRKVTAKAQPVAVTPGNIDLKACLSDIESLMELHANYGCVAKSSGNMSVAWKQAFGQTTCHFWTGGVEFNGHLFRDEHGKETSDNTYKNVVKSFDNMTKATLFFIFQVGRIMSNAGGGSGNMAALAVKALMARGFALPPTMSVELESHKVVEFKSDDIKADIEARIKLAEAHRKMIEESPIQRQRFALDRRTHVKGEVKNEPAGAPEIEFKWE